MEQAAAIGGKGGGRRVNKSGKRGGQEGTTRGRGDKRGEERTGVDKRGGRGGDKGEGRRREGAAAGSQRPGADSWRAHTARENSSPRRMRVEWVPFGGSWRPPARRGTCTLGARPQWPPSPPAAAPRAHHASASAGRPSSAQASGVHTGATKGAWGFPSFFKRSKLYCPIGETDKRSCPSPLSPLSGVGCRAQEARWGGRSPSCLGLEAPGATGGSCRPNFLRLGAAGLACNVGLWDLCFGIITWLEPRRKPSTAIDDPEKVTDTVFTHPPSLGVVT